MFAPLTVIAPTLVRRLFDLCQSGKLAEARAVQEDVAALRQMLKAGGVAALKAAARAMGRDCGVPRAPLLPLNAEAEKKLAAQMDALPALAQEPRGW
jgi:4-hydroxy-tetrahydrodipicolinate synthase